MIRASCNACHMRRVIVSENFCRKCAPKNVPNAALVLLRQWVAQEEDRGPNRLSRDATGEKIRRMNRSALT